MGGAAGRLAERLGYLRRRAVLRRNFRLALTGGDLHSEVAGLLLVLVDLSKDGRVAQ